jgi:hypothetical protein
MKCSIENCGKPAVSRGLCQTHYARQRRHGSPSIRRKPGRTPDATKSAIRSLFRDWSPRTFDRYWLAFQRMKVLCDLQGIAMDAAASPFVNATKSCTRDNGTLNVEEFVRTAESMCAMHVARVGS